PGESPTGARIPVIDACSLVVPRDSADRLGGRTNRRGFSAQSRGNRRHRAPGYRFCHLPILGSAGPDARRPAFFRECPTKEANLMKTWITAGAVAALTLIPASESSAQVVVSPPGTPAPVLGGPVYYSSAYVPPYSYYAAWPWPARVYVPYGPGDAFPFYGRA